jgi:hypothetical protein
MNNASFEMTKFMRLLAVVKRSGAHSRWGVLGMNILEAPAR